MNERTKNFNPGPAALPLAALERAQAELVNFQGTGMSILEHSHRGPAYEAVHNEAITLLRELLSIPDTHQVLFLQGGARLQFAMIPMNLLQPAQSADYLLTGHWAKGALKEANLAGKARAAANTESEGGFTRVPTQDEIDHDPNAVYLHLTSNNTLYGTQFPDYPTVPGSTALVADMTSDLLSRPIDISRFGIVYAGAQKNVGPAGVTVVVIRKDLVANSRTDIPAALRYNSHAEKNSLWNTPATFSIYMLRNTLAVFKEQGGLSAIEKNNRLKANILYKVIDEKSDFFRCPVEPRSRSLMNVVFRLPTEELEKKFLAEATERHMSGLKGHRTVGGLRASIYNAVLPEWVDELAEFMRDFARRN